jgi:glutaconyl-CoA decarboxylase
MSSVTTNPWLIAIINMTIVFAVLYFLGILMTVIRKVDPTKQG